MHSPDRFFLRRVLIILTLAGGIWLLWQLRTVWLLAFGSILVAIVLRALTEPIERKFSLPTHWALAAAVLLIVLLAALVVWMASSVLSGQIDELGQRIAEVRSYLESSRIGRSFIFEILWARKLVSRAKQSFRNNHILINALKSGVMAAI